MNALTFYLCLTRHADGTPWGMFTIEAPNLRLATFMAVKTLELDSKIPDGADILVHVAEVPA